MRERTMALRWSLVTAGLIALFWTIWYLVNGSVPVVTEIMLTKDLIYALPFGISRWWDVLIGPIGSTAFVLLLTNKRFKKDQDLGFGLIFGLGFGLGCGLIVGLSYGLFVGLIGGLIFGLGYGLFAGLGFELGFGLGYGLIVGLGFGLSYGLVFGLIFGLSYGLVFGLIFGLGVLLTRLISRQLWTKVWNWLMAK